MALVNQGFLGNASGKLGTVIFAKNRKTNTVRKHQPIIQDKKSPAQLTQRRAIKTITSALSPLQNNFIAFFNQTENNKQTPWTKAIKDNINALDVNGNFDLSKLKLGNQDFTGPIIKSVVYNPFIDQVCLNFSNYISSISNSFLLISFIGQYKQIDQSIQFDTRNLITMPIWGFSACPIQTDEDEWEVNLNWYIGGLEIASIVIYGH